MSYASVFVRATNNAAQPRQTATSAEVAAGAKKKYIQLRARFAI